MMDNPLTPNKIQRLMNLAEDTRCFTLPRRLMLNEEAKVAHLNQSKSTVNCESSSGILDLERVEAFGESGIGNAFGESGTCNAFGESGIGNDSIGSKSTAFNPGEMTGRSTGADDFQLSGRHSIALDTLTNQMDKQTNEIHDIMRHSIATEFSFHSKRDLTADEASLVRREAPLPVPNTNQSYFVENMSVNSTNLSVGAYFKHRCPEFGKLLGKTESPDRSALSSAMPSITEVSSTNPLGPASIDLNKYKMDETLDCVPVRQARPDKIQQIPNSYQKQLFNNDTYNKSELNFSSISKAPEMPKVQKTLNLVTSSPFVHKPHAGSSKPTDILIRNLQSSMRMVTEDTEGSAENSLSISKIADFLGKQSNISVSDMLQLQKYKNTYRKEPLTELHVNVQESDHQVTNLRDSRKMETASSAGTVDTVIALDKLNIQGDGKCKVEAKVPSLVVTHHSDDDEFKKRSTRSKSPSSKSPSTLSTVQENYASFKSGDSPLHNSKGDVNTSHMPSPNIEYRELDKSVDWHDVLQQKRLKQDGLAKEKWADVSATAAHGFVGVPCAVTVTVNTLTDSWLTAKLKFEDLSNDKDITIELPRLLLLSPGKSEQFIVNITSNVEMDKTVLFTLYLKDASIDADLEQQGTLDLSIKMPTIQAMSCDGVNKLTFPPIQEKASLTKSFVLLSDCLCDLQLDLSIESDGLFTIRSVHEIKKSDVNKVLMERQASTEDSKGKSKGMNKQLCRLSSGNAIRVTVKFNAPYLSELQIAENMVTLNAVLNVNLIGVSAVLRKVDLVGVVGTVNLVVKMPADKLSLTKDPKNLTVSNIGSIPGAWVVKFANGADACAFKVAPSKFEIRPGALKLISLAYEGAEDCVSETTIYFEEIASGTKIAIELTGGTDKPKSFPIKTNHNIMSWVRAGRKELSLKNSTDKKIHIRCHVVGEGFSIDVPGVAARDVFLLPFGPGECRPLPIMFLPTSNLPQAATLHLAYDKSSDFSRKVKLYGCVSGDALHWSGLVTYGDTALVHAPRREPVSLQLYNKTHAHAFVSAQLHFNLQYNSVASTARLIGNNCIIPPRSRHTLRLTVDWVRVERRARDVGTSALAAVTALTGAELTRRRILRVLRDNATGELDTSLLDDHLKVLAGQFEKEDPSMDNMLSEFKETKTSLNELIGGLHELTAQIVLPQDFADDNTIVITDDTVVEHHTLCD